MRINDVAAPHDPLRQSRNKDPQGGGEVAEEDRASLPAAHEGAGGVEVLLEVLADDGQAANGPSQEARPPPPADEVADGIADDRAGCRGDDDRRQGYPAP